MRISDANLRKKMLRLILEAEPDEIRLMAENLLGVDASHDQTEYLEWDVKPLPDLYCGAFDAEGLK